MAARVLPSALKGTPKPQYNYNDYVSELRCRLHTSHQQAHQNLIRSKNKSKEHYDETARALEIQVGEKVLLFDETVRRGLSRKLSAQWIGPYTLTEVDKVNVTIAKGRKLTSDPFTKLGKVVSDAFCIVTDEESTCRTSHLDVP